ncbi:MULTISPECIES: LysR family transcriptional regulator [Paraburkholderia]|nr:MULTISPECIES: LysR family transcriptional regulator [Paraburkholderia]MCP2088085.1 DNA-binding transcriptional LysR family regulator [Paraburkholderia sediminicola]MBK3822002.1 LysR family transcriptional regulator [Paraburkholderia aspalathi]MBK3833836.1 LysR family transcriptional regulator [Paraburkholderia aspalathi]MBK3863547.1 LysR family transcriptional regulator [Paraburkholderia aspalathi]MCX4139939.1 LysR family transcriptional regulator [Paraburkholderia aspalathi]
MNFSSLEIFCAVATEQSVTRAARHLARVQSNVTMRVQQLEEELQVQLFSRSGKRMSLTPSGRTMLGYAQRLLYLAEEARLAMSPEQQPGRLSIGAMESTAAARLPALLSKYHSRWPQVGLEISIGTSRSLVDDVERGHLDCVFVADSSFPGTRDPRPKFAARGLRATRAYREDLLLVLPPNHPTVNRPTDLRIKTLAAFSDGCAYRNVLEQWLGITGLETGGGWKVTELVSYHAILASVAAGSCFALCPRSILDLQCVPMDICAQKFATIDTYLVAQASYESSAYKELLQFLQTAMYSEPGGTNN